MAVGWSPTNAKVLVTMLPCPPKMAQLLYNWNGAPLSVPLTMYKTRKKTGASDLNKSLNYFVVILTRMRLDLNNSL